MDYKELLSGIIPRNRFSLRRIINSTRYLIQLSPRVRPENFKTTINAFEKILLNFNTYNAIERMLNLSSGELEVYMEDYQSKKALHNHIRKSISEVQRTSEALGAVDEKVSEVLYLIMRIIKPNTVVETGVASGISSAYILQALDDNGKGELYSIDLPKFEGKKYTENYFPGEEQRFAITPKSKQSGWIIPDNLRHRWHLLLGKSSEKLPPLLEKLGRIDIFIHDSLHTYENMLWEYKTAWPHIAKDGLLLSHDVFWHYAFQDFSKSLGHKAFYLTSTLGAIPKR
ncbi:MAG: class I SAM-dependent methyltransferase [Candidatus Freyarchaeota archaeon]